MTRKDHGFNVRSWPTGTGRAEAGEASGRAEENHQGTVRHET